MARTRNFKLREKFRKKTNQFRKSLKIKGGVLLQNDGYEQLVKDITSKEEIDKLPPDTLNYYNIKYDVQNKDSETIHNMSSAKLKPYSQIKREENIKLLNEQIEKLRKEIQDIHANIINYKQKETEYS